MSTHSDAAGGTAPVIPIRGLFRLARRAAADPRRAGRWVARKGKEAVRRLLRRVALRWQRLGPAYYALADRSFDREIHAVLHGQAAHERAENDVAGDPGSSSDDALRFTLTRNVHRLEKGILMRPRRSVFAEDYIEETTTVFAEVMRSASSDADGRVPGDDLLAWSREVLEEYFGMVEPTDPVKRGLATFEAACSQLAGPTPPSTSLRERVPYRRDLAPLGVDLDAMRALARRRRSVRWFLDEPVPREKIDRALEVALQSPSACNRQPYVFHIFDRPDLLRRVSRIPIGTRGYADNIPAMAVIVGRQRAYFSPRDRHLIYVDGGLAAMSFMYALEVQGLSSCPINWPDIEHKEQDMARFMSLAPDERPIMCVAIGYPDPAGLVAYSQKKPLDRARVYNLGRDETEHTTPGRGP